MQEEERVPRLLDRLDLDRFQLKQYRNFDDCEYRSPSLSTKPPGKAYELTYNHTFNQDLLITHLDIEFNQRDTFTSLFEVGEIQASKMTNRGMLGPDIRQNPPKSSRQDRSLVVSCSCITQSLKVSLLLKKQFLVLFNDSLNLKKERSKQASQQNAQKMVRHTIKAINICGFQLNISIGASELIPLLNISQAFKQSNRFQEAAEADVLVSLSLISARRFVQAAESLRNASKFYVEKYISSKSSMEFCRIDKAWTRQDNRDQLQLSGFSRTFSSGRGLQGGRYLYKAAKLELLLADTINQPTLLGEKLQAYNRANSFANGNINPIKLQTRIDYEEVAYNISPTIIPFLVKVLSDKAEIYKISALKSIEFFYDILGCSLGNFMPLILKTLILVYPTLKERDESGIKIENGSADKLSTSGRTKLLLDQTNHLLESLLSILPGINKKCLKMMYQEIIQVSISEEYRNELRLYLLRFGERIMQICGSDLQIAVPYIRYLFATAEGKYTLKSDTSKHVNHNLIYFSQRAIELLKTKILKQYNLSNSLALITNWINQSLIALCENETVSSQSQLNHTLDLVIAVYMATKRPLAPPIEPLVYLLNSSLSEPKLPFQKILQAFTVLVRHEIRFQNVSQLASEIVERVLGRSKICSLGLKQLRILERLLDTVSEVKTEWLADFLQCIPHSNYDEIYAIFDLLVLKCVRQLDKRLIQNIISTLFNQYTVKGKAHQQSKQLFISKILKNLPQSLSLLLQICLFENPQPRIADFASKNSEPKEHGFDSKQFKLQSELFGQKISLLVQAISKNELIRGKMQEQLSGKLVYQLYESINEILIKSNNFKIKSKLLNLMKHLIILIGQLPDDYPILKHKIFFCRTQLAVLRTFTTNYKDSKLQYYALINIGLLLQTITSIKSEPRDPSQTNVSFDCQFTPDFDIPFPLNFTVQSLALYEMSKAWVNLLPLLSSPLEQVRQMLLLILLHTFKRGLCEATVDIREKIHEQSKSLLASCLQSKDYSERLMAIRLLALLLAFGRDNQSMRIEVAVNLKHFLPLLQQVVLLEDDWNDEVSFCSRMITQICLTKQLRARLLKRRMPNRKSSGFFDTSSISLNMQEEAFVDKKSSFVSLLGGLDVILRTDQDFNGQEEYDIPELRPEMVKHLEEFRNQIEKINFSIPDTQGQRDSFAEEEQFFDPNEERHSDREKQNNNASDQEQLEFEDLGIIELDDEEWGEEENKVTITQKLPLKKVYKLSPNLGSSAKHHHLRNKRMLPNKLEEEKIIIDQLQGRISSPPPQQPRMRQNEPKELFDREQLLKVQFEDVQHRKNSVSQDFNVSEVRNSSKKEKKGTKKRKVSTAK